jgi:magnesium-transporting ATPase (P-type)
MVVGTGASTAKGRLIRAIKHPQSKTSHSADQAKDSSMFLTVLFVIVLVFIAWYAIYAAIKQHQVSYHYTYITATVLYTYIEKTAAL